MEKEGEGYRPDLYGDKPDAVTTKFSTMIWGCLSWFGPGTLAFVQGTMDSKVYIEVLEECLWPVMMKDFPEGGSIYQDDGAPIHTSNLVKTWKSDNNIQCLAWPPYSPDLNIIENAWFVIKFQLQKELHLIKSVDDLREAIKRVWAGLTVNYIRGLYNSIPRRIRSVQTLKGHRTKY